MFKKPIKEFNMAEALEFSLANVRLTQDLIEKSKKQIEEADAEIKLADTALEKIASKFEGDTLCSTEKCFQDVKNMLEILESQENDTMSDDEKFILNSNKQMVQKHLSNPIFEVLRTKDEITSVKAELVQKRDNGIQNLKTLEKSLKKQDEVINTRILKTEEQRADRGKMEMYFIANRYINDLPVSLTQEDLKEMCHKEKSRLQK